MRYNPFSLTQTLSGHKGAIYGVSQFFGDERFFTCGGDGWIVEWNISNPDPGKLIAHIENQVFTILVLEKEGSFVAGNMNGGIYWIDPGKESSFRLVTHHRKGVFDFYRQGDDLFSCGGDGLLTRWSITDQRPENSWQISNKALRCIDVHPSGTIMACGASDGRIYIMSMEAMKLLQIIEAAHVPSVFTVRFSGDGQLLWSGGRDACLRCWRLTEDFSLSLEIPAHMFTINKLAMDPTGAFIASGSRDKSIRIWNSQSGELLQVLDTVRDHGHRNSVNNLIWLSGDRPVLVSVSDDRTVKMWEAL